MYDFTLQSSVSTKLKTHNSVIIPAMIVNGKLFKEHKIADDGLLYK